MNKDFYVKSLSCIALLSLPVCAETINTGTIVCETKWALNETHTYKYLSGEFLKNGKCARAPKPVKVKLIEPGVMSGVIIENGKGQSGKFYVLISDLRK